MQPPRPLEHDILEAAARWYADLHISPDCPDTRKAHQQWLASDPRHRQAWARVEKLQHKLGILPTPIAHPSLRGAQLRRREMLKLCSLLLVGTGGAMSAWHLPWYDWTADQRTATGERRRIRLADGGHLELNTNTALDIRYSEQWREIRLYSGEIWIETAPDSLARPFIVNTAQGRVQALGTRFLVRTEADKTSVGVLQHRVAIQPTALPEANVQLEAGQYLEFSARHIGPIQLLDRNADAWTRDMLIINDWRLGDFIAELSRYRSGHLSCDPSVAELRISGAFHLKNTDLVLENLSGTLPVRPLYFTRYWTRLVAR
ncbi:FecR family protein [Azomonas agilis]|uniref:FecR family protein n=1 Tax=Azomonas agilis TaxID=116849 RepID=A0A562J1X1_9GAMM|nr:FecR domain-containing protein [Azomonas agilis]TWH77178.1 FecR family protein [Azomonas agilis]